jgi:hypothetical protein
MDEIKVELGVLKLKWWDPDVSATLFGEDHDISNEIA